MGKRNPNLIRVGDTVRVINPRKFIRCGYDLTPEIAGHKLAMEHAKEIAEFLKSIGCDSRRYFDSTRKWVSETKTFSDERNYIIHEDHRAMRKFLHGLGYLYGHAKGLGDGKRKIFYEPFEIADDPDGQWVWEVVDMKTVVTGDYFGPSGGYDGYSGEYDYEPGGLHDQKSHRIARLGLIPSAYTLGQLRAVDDQGLWMNTVDLEKITETQDIKEPCSSESESSTGD